MPIKGRRKREWGLYDRIITIQRPMYEALQITWDTENPVAENVPAQLIQASGGESFSVHRLVSESDATFRIRWIPGITTDHSIVENAEYGGRWNIISIERIGTRDRIDLVCQKVD